MVKDLWWRWLFFWLNSNLFSTENFDIQSILGYFLHFDPKLNKYSAVEWFKKYTQSSIWNTLNGINAEISAISSVSRHFACYDAAVNLTPTSFNVR